MESFRVNQKGNTLISVMISLGIMSIISAATMSLIESQRKQLKLMEQKSELVDLKKSIAVALEDPTLCSESLSNKDESKRVFNANETDPHKRKIPIFKIKTSMAKDAPDLIADGQVLSTGVVIDKVEVVNLAESNGDWIGQIQVSFKPNSSNFMLKPITLPSQKFFVDKSKADSASITGCSGSGSRSSSSASSGNLPPGVNFEPNEEDNFIEGYFPYKGITYTGNGSWGVISEDAVKIVADIQKKADEKCQTIYGQSQAVLTSSEQCVMQWPNATFIPKGKIHPPYYPYAPSNGVCTDGKKVSVLKIQDKCYYDPQVHGPNLIIGRIGSKGNSIGMVGIDANGQTFLPPGAVCIGQVQNSKKGTKDTDVYAASVFRCKTK